MINAKKLIKIVQKWQKFTALQRADKGHFAIYTADCRRFVLPLAYLNNPIFRQLLKMSEEEYGLPSDGPIVLPCDSIFMDFFVCQIRQGHAGHLYEEALLESIARSRCSASCWQVNQQVLLLKQSNCNFTSREWPHGGVQNALSSLLVKFVFPCGSRSFRPSSYDHFEKLRSNLLSTNSTRECHKKA